MKRLASLSISLLLLSACGDSPQERALAQCQSAVKHYTQWQKFTDVQQRASQQLWLVQLAFEVDSVFGPQIGKASCEYPLRKDRIIAAKPTAITLGHTRHTREQDIEALLTGRYANGKNLPEHSH